jgi:hypothetical protein
MKKIWPLLLFLLVGPALSITDAVGAADFTVTDIFTKPDNFVQIKLQNRSATDVPIQPALKEKIFLTIYIDNIKRAEYKLKYMDQRLFKKRGTVFFRTNFRTQKGMRLKVKAHVNPQKIIKETNFLNNSLQKTLQGN